MMVRVLAILSLCFACGGAFPSGAPTKACDSMVPGHKDASKQTSASPYKIALNTTMLMKGVAVVGSVSGISNEKLQGFLVEARNIDGNRLNGQFSTISQDPNVKAINCPGGTANAVTHTNAEDKITVAFVWSPPADLDITKGVVFRGTVNKEKNIWWEGVTSETLKGGATVLIPSLALMLAALAFVAKL